MGRRELPSHPAGRGAEAEEVSRDPSLRLSFRHGSVTPFLTGNLRTGGLIQPVSTETVPTLDAVQIFQTPRETQTRVLQPRERAIPD